MTAPPLREATPFLWGAVLRHLRAGRARRDDRASATMVSYSIGAAVFLMGSTFLLNFALDPPKVSGLESAESKSVGNSILNLLLNSPGYPASWNASSEADPTVRLQRMGLLDAGATIRLDPSKFHRLARGSFVAPNYTDDYVDYIEARRALGVDTHDFHLRAFPSAPLASKDNYGVTGMGSYSIAYIGDFTGGSPTDASKVEQGFLETLNVSFVNATRTSLAGAGSVFEDSSSALRNYLIPLLGTSVPQAVISEGSEKTWNFARVGPSILRQALNATPIEELSTALAITDGTTLGYGKNREMRAMIGVANFSGLSSVTVTWNELVDTGLATDLYGRDDGDYGFLEMSPDGGATWYPITNDAAGRSQDAPLAPHLPEGGWKTRLATVGNGNCAPCLGATSVQIAFHWVADGDSKKGKGWLIDDVKVLSAGFVKDFESPEFDMLVVGSNVDQNALTPREVKEGIRDFVEVYGGRLVVLGGDQNTNWLRPLFHVGVRDASPGVGTPDTTHPLLTVPNEMDYGSFQDNDKAWDFAGSDDTDLFHMVVGSGSTYKLAVSVDGAFSGSSEDGAVVLTTYLPYRMSTSQGLGFFANVITYGKYHHMYLDVGPEVPTTVPVAAITRSATMESTTTGSGEYVDLKFILYVWPGNLTASAQPSAGLVVTPTAPRGLAATAGPGQVTLTWAEPQLSGAGPVLAYNIYRGTAYGFTELYDTVPSSYTSYTETGLTNGITYYYNVTAENVHGQGYSTGTVNATPATIPGAPAAPGVVGAAGMLTVTWMPPSDTGGSSITNYTLNGTRTDNTAWFQTDVGLNTTQVLTGLGANEEWRFRVRATNAIGDGPWSGSTTANTTAIPPTPTGLVAVGGTSVVNLTWAAISPSVGITGFKIYRGTTLGAYSLLASVGASNISFNDTNVFGGTTYYYVIVATNANGDSSYSSPASATPIAVPNAPVFAATAGVARVNLTWAAVGDATSYRVYRGTLPGSPTLLAIVGASNTSFNDTNVVNGTTYYYTVSAANNIGESALPAEQVAIPLGLPAAPSVVAASGVSGGTVTLTITAPVDTGGASITHYRIYRGTTLGNIAYQYQIAYTGSPQTRTDTGLTGGTTYYYQVSAVTSAGEGGKSLVVSAVATLSL